ncbi:MAG: hypothetical protein R3B54_09765 [Bdellovibrionota bacterium]
MKNSSPVLRAMMAQPNGQESVQARNRWLFSICRRDDSLKSQGFYKQYPGAWTAIEQLRNSAEIPGDRRRLDGCFPASAGVRESAVEDYRRTEERGKGAQDAEEKQAAL